jgi:hypothetical protein
MNSLPSTENAPVALHLPTNPPREPLILSPPPFHLHDRLHSLSLTFTASLHILLPIAADYADWRDYILLRASGFTLNLTLEYNGIDISGTSGVPEIWARTVANAQVLLRLRPSSRPPFTELGSDVEAARLHHRPLNLCVSGKNTE